MLTILRLAWVRGWVYLACLMYVLPFPHIPPRSGWEGATEGWSPMAAVGSVEANDVWDVEGWLRDGSREYHAALREVEVGLWFSLDTMLRDVYEWRDQV